jgi:hypothetical protein
MSHNLLSQIEAGCNGRMKLENGKIVFEFGSHMVTPPPPSAPPLMADDPVVDELRTELRETKQRLAILEQQVQQLFKFREFTWCPRIQNHSGNMIHNFNDTKVRFLAPSYSCFIGNSTCYQANDRFGVAYTNGEYLENSISCNLRMISAHLWNLQIICIDFENGNTALTPGCGMFIKFVVEKLKTSQNNIEIIINEMAGGSRVNYIIALCEQLNHEKLSKLKISKATISEKNELNNKLDKNIFKKIEIEKLVPSV